MLHWNQFQNTVVLWTYCQRFMETYYFVLTATLWPNTRKLAFFGVRCVAQDGLLERDQGPRGWTNQRNLDVFFFKFLDTLDEIMHQVIVWTDKHANREGHTHTQMQMKSNWKNMKHIIVMILKWNMNYVHCCLWLLKCTFACNFVQGPNAILFGTGEYTTGLTPSGQAGILDPVLSMCENWVNNTNW